MSGNNSLFRIFICNKRQTLIDFELVPGVKSTLQSSEDLDVYHVAILTQANKKCSDSFTGYSNIIYIPIREVMREGSILSQAFCI